MMPDMFADAPRETDLCSYLLQDIYTDVKLPEEFLHELAKRFDDDGLVEVIGSTITGISEEIASLKFNENYRSVLRVCLNVMSLSIGNHAPGPMQTDSFNHA